VLGAPVAAPDADPGAAPGATINAAGGAPAPVDAAVPLRLGRLLRTRTDHLSLRSWR
jgi:hypothetical protein